MSKKESIKVLEECAELQLKKSNDYQNPNSNIVQADYYPRGVATILDTVYGKILRMYSVLEAMEHDKDYNPNFESLEDSAKDLINYSSFIVAYIRGEVEGQSNDRDFLNRKKAEVNMWDPQETEVSVSGVPYKVDRSILSNSINTPYQKLNTEPTYIGDNHWLRSDGTTFKNSSRPKPDDWKDEVKTVRNCWSDE
tara:strand:- start:3352 stop:3936 length:585 start_codon:yes stop_codon:yes gene_type:complete